MKRTSLSRISLRVVGLHRFLWSGRRRYWSAGTAVLHPVARRPEIQRCVPARTRGPAGILGDLVPALPQRPGRGQRHRPPLLPARGWWCSPSMWVSPKERSGSFSRRTLPPVPVALDETKRSFRALRQAWRSLLRRHRPRRLHCRHAGGRWRRGLAGLDAEPRRAGSALRYAALQSLRSDAAQPVVPAPNAPLPGRPAGRRSGSQFRGRTQRAKDHRSAASRAARAPRVARHAPPPKPAQKTIFVLASGERLESDDYTMGPELCT